MTCLNQYVYENSCSIIFLIYYNNGICDRSNTDDKNKHGEIYVVSSPGQDVTQLYVMEMLACTKTLFLFHVQTMTITIFYLNR